MWTGSKGRFPLQTYRSETYRISLSREHSGRTNDMDTIEYATFRYDTVEVENELKSRYSNIFVFIDCENNQFLKK